jgi:hypothetical protein
MNQLAILARRFGFKKDTVFPILFTLVSTTIVFVDSNYLHYILLTSMSIFSVTLLTTIIIGVMLVAGYTVYKAVIHASVGFGVMIFLTQTYCNLKNTTPDGIQALTVLWTVGFVFILYEFGNALQNAYRARIKFFREDKSGDWQSKVLLVVYSLFIIMFLVLIYKVLSPIVQDLCIYKVT